MSTRMRVADVGSGAGWSTLAMAKAFPQAEVVGFDADPASVHDAQRNAAAHGVAVRFEIRDAAAVAEDGPFDFVLVLEALHDMARPDEALRAIREALAPGGSVLVADEKVGDHFHAPADDLERLMYGWSIVHCLPVAMAEQPTAAIGTVIRAATVQALATGAGFPRVEVVPVTGASSACIGYVRSECVRMLLVGAPDASSVVEDIMSANVRIALVLVASVSASGLSASGQQPATEASTATPRAPVLRRLGALHLPVTTKDARAQAFFDQGLRLLYAFNHAEARRAFREAARLDPSLRWRTGDRRWTLAVNLNAPMSAENGRPAYAAPAAARAGLGHGAGPKERALIEALAMRFAAEGPRRRPRSIAPTPTR